jgi:hypothetical protein
MLINLLIFGALGMTIEVLFNAILSYALGRRNSFCLKGEISAWMFPVYAIGLTIGFDIIEQTITVTTLRWLSYPLWIWGIELLIGIPTKHTIGKLWDYSDIPYGLHYQGIISFFHAPFWILFGMIFEILRQAIL